MLGWVFIKGFLTTGMGLRTAKYPLHTWRFIFSGIFTSSTNIHTPEVYGRLTALAAGSVLQDKDTFTYIHGGAFDALNGCCCYACNWKCTYFMIS